MESNNKDNFKLELRKGILNTFQEQFAQNQNHNQKLFIQFFSAVIIVIAAYALVFTYTNSNSLDFDIKEISNSSSVFYFSLSHLLGSYCIAQVVLIFLSSLILNIGYGFRREQKITSIIREIAFEDLSDDSKATSELKFQLISRNFSPYNKGLLRHSFLPTFNAIFFNFILLVQIFFLISIVFTFIQVESSVFDLFHKHFFISLFLFSIPIFITLLEYVRYFIKYKIRIDEDKLFKGARLNERFSVTQELFVLVPIMLGFDYYFQPSLISSILRVSAILIFILCLLFGLIGSIYIFLQPKLPRRMEEYFNK